MSMFFCLIISKYFRFPLADLTFKHSNNTIKVTGTFLKWYSYTQIVENQPGFTKTPIKDYS